MYLYVALRNWILLQVQLSRNPNPQKRSRRVRRLKTQLSTVERMGTDVHIQPSLESEFSTTCITQEGTLICTANIRQMGGNISYRQNSYLSWVWRLSYLCMWCETKSFPRWLGNKWQNNTCTYSNMHDLFHRGNGNFLLLCCWSAFNAMNNRFSATPVWEIHT